MLIAIEGISCIGPYGFGPTQLLSAFASPPETDCSGDFPVLPEADTSVLDSYIPPRAMRQMDHFTRMAFVCAYAAIADGDLSLKNMREAGIIISSGYGPAAPTFAFIDSIEEYGARLASPFLFSRSVQNIPAASIALKLGMTGPCATICQFESSVAAGLLTAAIWLAEKRVSRVLFGAVDEYMPILANVTARIINEKTNGNTKQTAEYSHRRSLPLGEGAAFFCLSADTDRASRGHIVDIDLAAYSDPTGYTDFINDRLAALPPSSNPDIFCSGSLAHLTIPLADAALQRGRVYGNIAIAQALDVILACVDKKMGDPVICASMSPSGAFSSVTVAPGMPTSPSLDIIYSQA